MTELETAKKLLEKARKQSESNPTSVAAMLDFHKWSRRVTILRNREEQIAKQQAGRS